MYIYMSIKLFIAHRLHVNILTRSCKHWTSSTEVHITDQTESTNMRSLRSVWREREREREGEQPSPSSSCAEAGQSGPPTGSCHKNSGGRLLAGSQCPNHSTVPTFPLGMLFPSCLPLLLTWHVWDLDAGARSRLGGSIEESMHHICMRCCHAMLLCPFGPPQHVGVNCAPVSGFVSFFVTSSSLIGGLLEVKPPERKPNPNPTPKETTCPERIVPKWQIWAQLWVFLDILVTHIFALAASAFWGVWQRTWPEGMCQDVWWCVTSPASQEH